MVRKGRYLIKFQSYGITNVQGRGRNGLTLRKCFWGHFIELLFCTIFAKDHGHFFFLLLFFKEDNLMSFLNSAFSEGTIAGIFDHFWKWIGTQWRFWAELWGNCLVVVDAIPGVGNCHTRRFEASNEMDTQRRKIGR